MKKRVIAVILAVITGLSATACGSQKTTKEVNSVSVSGVFPEAGDVIVTNTYIGTVEPQESVTVYPMASGNVTEISATVGKEVKKGDVLFKMDSAAADQELADAEEVLEKAEKLAKQAKEDAEELEEALKKVDQAEEKASLEVEVEALEKKVAGYKKDYEDANDDYEDLNKEYSNKQYKSSKGDKNVWTKEQSDAKAEALALAKKLAEQAKSIYDTANTELIALKKELSSASKTTSSSSTSKKTTSASTTSSSKTDSSKDSDSKDSEKESTSKTETVSTGNTVYDQMVEDAQKAVDAAKAKQELYQVAAPIDGVIEAVFIGTNEKAFEDTGCMVISNKSNIEVTFQVAEAAALQLSVGEKVTVEKDGAMNEASITEISMVADEQTKLFYVKASLGAVTGFSTGTDVKVLAETKKAQNVLRIPYDALYFQGGTAYVYCADDDEAVRKEVQVGLMNDEYAQILDGLTEEDIVISTWSSQLKNGADIHLLFVIGGNTVNPDTEDTTEDDVTETSGEPELENTEPDDSENTEEEYRWQLPDLD